MLYFFRCILLTEDPRPKVQVEGEAAEHFRRHGIVSHVSLSHDAGLAIASVILESATVVPYTTSPNSENTLTKSSSVGINEIDPVVKSSSDPSLPASSSTQSLSVEEVMSMPDSKAIQSGAYSVDSSTSPSSGATPRYSVKPRYSVGAAASAPSTTASPSSQSPAPSSSSTSAASSSSSSSSSSSTSSPRRSFYQSFSETSSSDWTPPSLDFASKYGLNGPSLRPQASSSSFSSSSSSFGASSSSSSVAGSTDFTRIIPINENPRFSAGPSRIYDGGMDEKKTMDAMHKLNNPSMVGELDEETRRSEERTSEYARQVKAMIERKKQVMAELRKKQQEEQERLQQQQGSEEGKTNKGEDNK